MFLQGVAVSGDPILVADLRASLECQGICTTNIQPPTPATHGYGPLYYQPPPIAFAYGVPPDLIIELAKITFQAVLTVLLQTLVKWQYRAKLKIVFRDDQGVEWTFEGSPAVVHEQIRNTLGMTFCSICHRLVPINNFCSNCGNPL